MIPVLTEGDNHMDIPNDIFTEPEDVDAETLANLGPLRRLAGIWEGMRGVDLIPTCGEADSRQGFSN